jgi:acetyl esterase/lipase
MVVWRRDLAFAEHDGVTLRGDLCAPEGAGPHPVLVAAPGGGWLRGERGQLASWAQRLAANGVGMFITDYRRSTNGKIFPQNARDVLAALRFVDGAAEELGVDRARIGLLGSSAGAHLAALVCLASGTPLLAEGYAGDKYSDRRPSVRVLVGVYGVYDLPMHWRACQRVTDPSNRDDLAERMIGAPYQQSEQVWAAASPITYVSSAGSDLKALIIWGDADETVLPEQSVAFAAALRAAGRNVVTAPVSGGAHFWFGRDDAASVEYQTQVAPKIIEFLKRHLVA